MTNRIIKQCQVRKASTFGVYVAARSAQIEKMLQQALNIVDATKFCNVTEYCKALAAIISEVREAKSGDPTTPFYNKRVRKFSYITLLRNEGYRRLVDMAFNHSRESLEQPEAISEEALLKVSSLQAQINLLKDRLSGIRTGDSSNALKDANAQEAVQKLCTYLSTTLAVYSAMRQSFTQITKIVTSPTERYKTPGLHCSVGLIADLEALQEIEDGRKFLQELCKAEHANECTGTN